MMNKYKLELTDIEIRFIEECIWAASREGFYNLSDEIDEEIVGTSVLKKFGMDSATIDDYLRGY